MFRHWMPAMSQVCTPNRVSGSLLPTVSMCIPRRTSKFSSVSRGGRKYFFGGRIVGTYSSAISRASCTCAKANVPLPLATGAASGCSLARRVIRPSRSSFLRTWYWSSSCTMVPPPAAGPGWLPAENTL